MNDHRALCFGFLSILFLGQQPSQHGQLPVHPLQPSLASFCSNLPCMAKFLHSFSTAIPLLMSQLVKYQAKNKQQDNIFTSNASSANFNKFEAVKYWGTNETNNVQFIIYYILPILCSPVLLLLSSLSLSWIRSSFLAIFCFVLIWSNFEHKQHTHTRCPPWLN